MDVALTRPDIDAAAARHSRRRLVAVVLLVVLVHAWLLQHSSDIVQPGLPGAERLVTRPMQTRQIAAEPPPSAARGGAIGARRVDPPQAQQAAAAPRPSAISVHNAGADKAGVIVDGEVPASKGAAKDASSTATGLEPGSSSGVPLPAALPMPAAATTSSEPGPVAPANAPPAAGGGSPQLAIPGSTTLRYVVSATSRGRPYQVNGTLQWQHDGERYQARLEISAFLLGARVQTSVGRIAAEGLAPTRFGDRARSEQATHFQRDKGIISFSNNAPDAPLQPGAQDRLSVILQLGAMLAGAPQRYPPGTVVSLQTAGVRDAEPWQFSVIGPESLQLPGGTLEAVKLLRLPRREFDQTIELWLAPTLQYLPARVRLTQGNGDVADQQWLSGGTP